MKTLPPAGAPERTARSPHASCCLSGPSAHRFAIHSFGACFGGRVRSAVAWQTVIGLARRKIGVLLHARLVGGDQRPDFLAQPCVLPDDIPALFRVRREVEGTLERPVFNHAIDTVEAFHMNLVAVSYTHLTLPTSDL